MINQKGMVVVAILALGSLILSLNSVYLSSPYYEAPYAKATYLATENYVAGRGMVVIESSESGLPEEYWQALTLRDATQYNGKVVPIGFPFYYVILAVPFALGESIIFYSSAVWLVITALFVLLLGRSLGGRTAGYFSFYLVFTIPTIWVLNTNLLEGMILVTLFFVAGTFYVAKFLKGMNQSNAYLGILFLMMSVILRYNVILCALPISLYATYFLIKKSALVKAISILISMGTLLLTPLLILNSNLYGGPFRTGYNLLVEQIETATTTKLGFIVSFNLTYFYGHIVNNIVPYLSSLLFLSIVSVAFYMRKRRTYGTFAGLLIIVSIFSIFYLGGRNSFGYDDLVISSSFLRLNFFVWMLLLSVIALYLTHQKHHMQKYCLVVALALIVMISMMNVIGATGGLTYHYKKSLFMDDYREYVLANTDKDGIIITDRLDKMTVPDRTTLVLTYLSSPEALSANPENYWSIRPTEERLAEIIAELHKQNRSIYVATYGAQYVDNKTLFTQLLTKKGLRITNQNSPRNIRVEEIT